MWLWDNKFVNCPRSNFPNDPRSRNWKRRLIVARDRSKLTDRFVTGFLNGSEKKKDIIQTEYLTSMEMEVNMKNQITIANASLFIVSRGNLNDQKYFLRWWATYSRNTVKYPHFFPVKRLSLSLSIFEIGTVSSHHIILPCYRTKHDTCTHKTSGIQ